MHADQEHQFGNSIGAERFLGESEQKIGQHPTAHESRRGGIRQRLLRRIVQLALQLVFAARTGVPDTAVTVKALSTIEGPLPCDLH